MFNQTTPENVVDINSYLAHPLPTGPKNAPIGDTSANNIANLAQTNKKLVTIVMGMTIMIGLVACIAYLAGRAMTIARTSGTQQVAQRSAPLPIVVDSPKVSTPKSDPPRMEVAKPVAMPVPTSPAKVEKVPSSTGAWHVQVGYIEKDQIGSFRQKLQEKGFSSFAIAGDSPDSSRILLGPIPDSTAREAMQRRLRAAGYESFQRRY